MNGDDDRRRTMKPHATDVLSLVFGLIFLGMGGWWLVAAVATVTVPFGWLAAGSLIAIGVVGLIAAIRAGRRGTPS
ncbi:MAG TPA: hypothetical protein VGN37_05570 [Actinocatenispora sp.]